DVAITSAVKEKAQASVEATLSKPMGEDTQTAAAAAIAFGFYQNTAQTIIADGARIDASRAFTATAHVEYPFVFPTTAADPESHFGLDLSGSAANLISGNLGLDQYLFNNWVKTSVNAPSADVGIAGSVSVPIYTNVAEVKVGNALINQDAAYRSATQSV